MNGKYISYILWIMIGIAVFIISYQIISTIRTYKLIELGWAKITNNIARENLIRRENLQRKIENEANGISIEEHSILEKIYIRIKRLEILDKIPFMNELSLLLIYGIGIIITWIIISIKLGIGVGTLIVLGIVFTIHSGISRIIRGKELAIENELFSFINACQCSASIHPDIIDIFDDIAESQAKCLRNRLQNCVAESKHTRNKALALKHLKQSSSSTAFISVINALEICSATTGGYAKTIDALRETTRIHHASTEKKIAVLRNAKMNCLIMMVLGGIILYMCNIFFEEFFSVLLTSSIGILLLAIGVFILLLELMITVD